MATRKISELSAALGVDITPNTDVIIINDGDITKKITINELLSNLDNITVAKTGSFGRVEVEGFVTASNLGVDANTLFIGGTSFNKANLDDLKEGKSLNASQIEIGGVSFTKDEIERLKEGKTINTSTNRLTKRIVTPSRAARPTKGTAVSQTMDDIQKVDALVNNVDDTTFIKANESGAFDFIVNNTSSFAITTESVDISVPVFLPSITGSTSFTGSTEFSGSTVCSGSFTVTDLLTVLADFGQTGSFSVSGSTALAGDVNMDGAVTVTDLLTVVAGINSTGSCDISGSFSSTGSFSVVANNPDLGLEPAGFTVGGSAVSVTGSTDMTGSLVLDGPAIVSGTLDLTGAVTINDVLNVIAGFEASGGIDVSSSQDPVAFNSPSFNATTGTGGFNINNLLDLLANFGQTGIPTGSGQGGVAEGDINLDGQVNVSDLMLLLAGYGNPNILVTNTTIPPNVNHQFVGPELSISSSITLSVSTGSFCSITL